MGQAVGSLRRWTVAALIPTLALSCTSGSHPAARSSPRRTGATVGTQPGQPPRAPGSTPGVSHPTGATFTAPAAVPADCSADVTAQLSAWLATVPDNAIASLPGGACFRIDGTLSLQKRANLELDGNGATLKAGTEGNRDRAHVRIVSSSNVAVRDLVVRGANPRAGSGAGAYRPDREAQHGFVLGKVDGLLLDHVQVYDVFGDFVYVGGQSPSTHVTVRDSRFERSGRQGISVTNGDDVVVEANTIGDVPRSLFDLEPNNDAARARQVQVLSNHSGPVHNFWLASKGRSSNVGDVTIRGNVADDPSGGLVWVMTPAKLAPRSSFTVDGNTFVTRGDVSDEGSVGAIFFERCTDVAVTANRVELRHPQPAVELRHASRVTVTANHFDGATRAVVADAASTDVHQG